MNDNLSIVRRHMALMAAGDFAGALAMASDSILFQGPDGARLDKAGMTALLEQVKGLMPNPLELEITGTTCEAARVAVEASGKTALANGRTYANIYHFLYEIEGGKIVALREYCDTSRAGIFTEPGIAGS